MKEKYHLVRSVKRKRRVKSFLAGHFGLYLGNFGGLVIWSESKSRHNRMLVHFYHLNFQFEDFDCWGHP